MSRVNPVKFGQVERLDSHHKAILEFIKNTPNCTENQVVKAMEEQKVCSKMTTLRKLDELIEKQEISDLLKQGGSGFHRFIINEHNEFNKIYNWLAEIDSILNEIEDPMADVYNYIVGIPEPDPGHPDPSIPDEWYDRRTELFRDFSLSCYAPIERLLDFLFILSNRVIQYEKDSQLLNKIIADLNLKLMDVFSMNSAIKDIDLHLKDDISTLDGWLSYPELRQYTKEPEITVDFGYNLVKKIEKFRTEVTARYKSQLLTLSNPAVTKKIRDDVS